jgi:hypothetical protein
MTSSAATLERPAQNLRIFALDLQNDPRWEAFISSHPAALVYHHPAWLRTLESEYGEKCIPLACEGGDGKLRAILPLSLTKGLPFAIGNHATGRRLSSLPRTPIAGPLAMDQEATTEILRAAIDLARDQHAQLELKTTSKGLEQSVRELACLPWRFTYITQLPHPSDALWDMFCERERCTRDCGICEECTHLRFGNARKQHRVKWAANKALRLGLRIRDAENEQDLKEWYRLYLDAMRPNAVPPRPYRFFRDLWSNMRPTGLLRLAIAERHAEDGQKRMVAGSILLGFGQTVCYSFTGCAPTDFGLHPHDIIQLDSIRTACKQGFRWYDFGEVPDEHEELNQFKSKWGSEPQRLYRYYYPAAPDKGSPEPGRLNTAVRQIWRRLPLSATACLGDWIYRYL